MTEFEQALAFVKNALSRIRRYDQASRTMEFDQVTICPEEGKPDAGETLVVLKSLIYKITHDEDFHNALETLYMNIDRLDDMDKCMVRRLRREYYRTVDYGASDREENLRIKNSALINWMSAREQDSWEIFGSSLYEIVHSEKRRVSVWRKTDMPEPDALYDRMIDEYEPGMRMEILDPLFEETRKGIVELSKRVSKSKHYIRKDFLYRKVTDEQQRNVSDFLIDTLGFDMNRGLLTLAEYPFTEAIGPDNVRMATYFEDRNFLANYFSILHECGHALFEQLLPEDNHKHFINRYISMGMHESVARFYENIVGRSRAFIRYVYPKLSELMPQVFFDVTEEEFYEAVNLAEPGLIRMDADELNYNLHIIIRYEIEKQMIEGNLDVSQIPEIWKKMYREYLGVEPKDDLEGALQDSHWVDGFGYFPTYALGNLYAAAFYAVMVKDFDVDKSVSKGHFDRINRWMSTNLFSTANTMDAIEWIKSITGEEISAEPFLSYLGKKYNELYVLTDTFNESEMNLYDYTKRMQRIKLLSSTQVDRIDSARVYRSVLVENFKTIGQLAEENRRVIDEIINPILESDEELSEDTITMIRTFNDSLMNTYDRENVDLPVMSMLSERLMKDALQKKDDDYIVMQLDEEIDAATALIAQVRRLLTDDTIKQRLRERGQKALDMILYYLDKDRFLSLSEESRKILMVNSRFADAIYEDIQKQSDELRKYQFDLLFKSIKYASDPFYLEALPNYDWKYHLYRAYQYISSMDMYDNVKGFSKEELDIIAEYGEKVEALWESDPDYYGELDSSHYVKYFTLRNRMTSGRLPVEEYRKSIAQLYESRETRRYDADSIIDNIDIPREYIASLDHSDLTEDDKMTIESMYRAVILYVFNMPKTGTLYELMDYYAPLLFNFVEVPGGLDFEEMGLQSFAAFHPPTYIHSKMVAQISLCLTSRLLRKAPELFVGVLGTSDVREVIARKNEIEDHVYHAALCHDFGKLVIIDTVMIYGRKLLDVEFGIIKQHPALGAMMLRKYSSTAKYADIALGHHLWYNGKGGYPTDFDASKSSDKILIDLVTIADCMDAATDSVGRSYNRGKTFHDFREEVKRDSGVRYAPFLVDLLFDEDVASDMDTILTTRRKQSYFNTYNLLKAVDRTDL